MFVIFAKVNKKSRVKKVAKKKPSSSRKKKATKNKSNKKRASKKNTSLNDINFLDYFDLSKYKKIDKSNWMVFYYAAAYILIFGLFALAIFYSN